MQTIEHKDFTVILTSKNQANVIFNYSYEKLKEKNSDLEDKKLSFKDTDLPQKIYTNSLLKFLKEYCFDVNNKTQGYNLFLNNR